MTKNDRILNNIYNLIEMVASGTGGFTTSANDAGPVAGYDPLMRFKKTKNNRVDRRTIPYNYKKWLKYIEGK